MKKLSSLADCIARGADALEEAVVKLADASDIISESEMIRDSVLVKMGELRVPCDEAEVITAKDYWPLPSYGEILFSVN